jgi:hypothetical protein
MMPFWKTGRKSGTQSEHKRLITRLDHWFSEYIRRRDANASGYARCCTCGAVGYWSDMDCGHFISRDRKAVRWMEQNAHAQCQSCNRFHSGRQYEHGQHIDRIYGPGTARHILDLSNVRGCKMGREWLRIMVADMKAKVQELRNEQKYA